MHTSAQRFIRANQALDAVIGQVDQGQMELTLPDEPTLYETAAGPDLPPGWDASPPRAASIDVGTAFVRAGRALGLIVPSAIVPEARNIVLNPAHPRFADVGLAISRPFAFDGRLRNG